MKFGPETYTITIRKEAIGDEILYVGQGSGISQYQRI
jgi:hypothetical protein